MDGLFARKLSELLRERGINQKELANMTGLTPAAISRYLNGSRTPRPVVISKIASALCVDVDSLIGTDDEKHVDEAIQLISRNANKLSIDQREKLIRAIIKQ